MPDAATARSPASPPLTASMPDPTLNVQHLPPHRPEFPPRKQTTPQKFPIDTPVRLSSDTQASTLRRLLLDTLRATLRPTPSATPVLRRQIQTTAARIPLHHRGENEVCAPLVPTRWAWCMKRSTAAVARVAASRRGGRCWSGRSGHPTCCARYCKGEDTYPATIDIVTPMVHSD